MYTIHIVSQSCPRLRNVNKIPKYNLPCHFIQICECIWINKNATNNHTYNIRNFTFCCLLFGWTALFRLHISFMCDIIYKYIWVCLAVPCLAWCVFFFVCFSFVSFSYCGFFPLLDLRVMENELNAYHNTDCCFRISISFRAAFHFYVILSLWVYVCVFYLERHLDIMNREHCLLLLVLVLLLRCSHLDYT